MISIDGRLHDCMMGGYNNRITNIASTVRGKTRSRRSASTGDVNSRYDSNNRRHE